MIETRYGQCKHGKFDLTEGCPLCIAERQAKEAVPPAGGLNLIKVRYVTESGSPDNPVLEVKGREYTYYSVDPVKVGDFVQVPVRDHVITAKVTEVNVSDWEIVAFRDKVKTIPSGSIRPDPAIPRNQEQIEIERDIQTELDWKNIESLDPLEDSRTEEEKATDAQDQVAIIQPLGEDEVAAIEDEGGTREDVIMAASETINYPPALVVIQDRVGVPLTGLFQLYQEAASLHRFAMMREIKTNEDLKPATEDLTIIAKCIKNMNARKAEILSPFKLQVTTINQAFDELMAPIVEADLVTRKKVKQYQEEANKRAAESRAIEEEKLRLAQREAAFTGTGETTVDLGTVQETAPAPATFRTDMGTLSGRDNWKAEVVDFAALPDEWKVPDMTALNAKARSTKGKASIPGVRFYNDRIIAVRARNGGV